MSRGGGGLFGVVLSLRTEQRVGLVRLSLLETQQSLGWCKCKELFDLRFVFYVRREDLHCELETRDANRFGDSVE